MNRLPPQMPPSPMMPDDGSDEGDMQMPQSIYSKMMAPTLGDSTSIGPQYLDVTDVVFMQQQAGQPEPDMDQFGGPSDMDADNGMGGPGGDMGGGPNPLQSAAPSMFNTVDKTGREQSALPQEPMIKQLLGQLLTERAAKKRQASEYFQEQARALNKTGMK